MSNPSKPPDELKRLGLKHLPAIVHGEEGFDAEDDIVTYLDDRRVPRRVLWWDVRITLFLMFRE